MQYFCVNSCNSSMVGESVKPTKCRPLPHNALCTAMVLLIVPRLLKATFSSRITLEVFLSYLLFTFQFKIDTRVELGVQAERAYENKALVIEWLLWVSRQKKALKSPFLKTSNINGVFYWFFGNQG